MSLYVLRRWTRRRARLDYLAGSVLLPSWETIPKIGSGKFVPITNVCATIGQSWRTDPPGAVQFVNSLIARGNGERGTYWIFNGVNSANGDFVAVG
jgi:hypothetical protein